MSRIEETLVIDMPTKEQSEAVLGGLLLRSMQHTFCDMMEAHNDLDRANQGMETLFGEIWDASKERVWQWYDLEATNEVG